MKPLYLLSGDDPLLMQQAYDKLRAQARDAGYTEVTRLYVETGFDWDSIRLQAQNLSLFSEKRLIELVLTSTKPGDKGRKALVAYADDLPADTCLIIRMPKLDKTQLQARWIKTLKSAGELIQIWPLDAKRLPQWIKEQLGHYKLTISPEALHLLADNVEGNLLAAWQMIEKLHLLHDAGDIDIAAVQALVSDMSRFDVFELIDTALEQNAPRVIKIIQGLQAEGVEPTLVLWALTRELRVLIQLANGTHTGFIWEKRKALLQQALRFHQVAYLQRLLQFARQIDAVLKGARTGHVWQGLQDLSLRLAGVRVL